jgi:hypothetical protein
LVKFDDLLSWDGTNLFEAGDALVAASHKYEQVNTDLSKPGLGDGLAGHAAEAEAKARRILADDAEDLWTGLSSAGNDLKDASGTVTGIKNSANDLRWRIQGDDLTIVGETVTTSPTHQGAYPQGDINSYQAELDNLIDKGNDTVTFISSVFDKIASLDDTANGPSPEVVNHGERPPNPKWTPSQVNDWWTSLTDAQRQNIIEKHPSWIGNLSGIPSNDRHEANMVWLPIMKREIDQKVADFEPKKTITWHSTAGGSGYYTETPNPEYEALLKRQQDIHALSAMFFNDKGERKDTNGRTLMVLDNSGDHFRAAVASGDVDNADHVVVHTPGMTTTVENGIARENGQPGGSVNGTETIMKESGLEQSTAGNKDQETVAGVTWLGYDAPGWQETLNLSEGTVLNDNEAKKAAPDLADFYDGLQATHHGDPHMLAYGHSYGSNVTGNALELSDAPDDVAVAGSPGPGSVDASELGMLPNHMHAAQAPGDPVASQSWWLPGFGEDPISSPDSDYTQLDTNIHHEAGLGPSGGHSMYTTPGTTSAHNLGEILRGDNPSYVLPKKF